MTSRMIITASVLSFSLGMMGCSFSASVGNMHTLEGKDKITVAAAQPELPKPPPPKPKIKKKAKVVGKKIEITEKVMFDYNKASIKEDSFALLNDVASVMKEHEKIEKVRIEGHTDADGTEEYNKNLSQNRADSVKEFLVKAGIDESRLEAVGYGEEKPIADNDTKEGKEKNRRVEFNIIKQQ